MLCVCLYVTQKAELEKISNEKLSEVVRNKAQERLLELQAEPLGYICLTLSDDTASLSTDLRMYVVFTHSFLHPSYGMFQMVHVYFGPSSCDVRP